MRVRVDRSLRKRGASDAREAARFLRALLYAHAIAAHRTHPMPSTVAMTVTAVESWDSEATAFSTSTKAVGGPGDGARGDGASDGASGGEGAPSRARTSFVGATISSTATVSAAVLRKVEATVLSASLAVMAVSAVVAAASLCMLTVKSILTLPAVAVASTASRGTAASSATFWRIGVSTACVKVATSPAMVTAIFTVYAAGAIGGGGDCTIGGGDDCTIGGGDDCTIGGGGGGDCTTGGGGGGDCTIGGGGGGGG
eukprot:scaffold51605_cov64-Phaeocystis_antarctica.AAC.11